MTPITFKLAKVKWPNCRSTMFPSVVCCVDGCSLTDRSFVSFSSCLRYVLNKNSAFTKYCAVLRLTASRRFSSLSSENKLCIHSQGKVYLLHSIHNDDNDVINNEASTSRGTKCVNIFNGIEQER